MFTIEDIDIHAEMAVLAALSPELLDPVSHPIPEACLLYTSRCV